MKPYLVYDTECYKNFWLFMGKDLSTGRVYIIATCTRLTPFQIAELHGLMQTHTWVSFNGIHYDKPMIELAMTGANTYELKEYTNKIIMTGIKGWQHPRDRQRDFDHIDLIEVAKGKCSLKKYGARMGCVKLQELPYPHDAELTPEQQYNVTVYCGNDIFVTETLFHKLKEKIEVRIAYSAQWGIDLRSKSDAQLSESVINRVYYDKYGKKPDELNLSQTLHFRYKPPAWMQFKTTRMQEILHMISITDFYVVDGKLQKPPELQELVFELGGKTYKMGIGGLHSQEKQQFLRADAQWKLFDVDVASNYPQAILNSGEYPPALGPIFIPIYSDFKDKRLIAKAEYGRLKKDKTVDRNGAAFLTAKVGAEAGKIMLNGPFGKMNSKYSKLFAPSMFIATTVGNQLALIMLIETLVLANIRIMSANTDGILVMPHVSQVDQFRAIVKEWERICNYEVEEVEYKLMAARDVNNYVALPQPTEKDPNPDPKRKGEFALTDFENKDPYCEICADAVVKLLKDNVPVEDTIRSCNDIKKFVMVESSKDGVWKIHGEEPEKAPLMADIYARIGTPAPGKRINKADLMPQYLASFKPAHREFIGKTIRYYYSFMQPGVMKTGAGTTIGKSEGAQQMMLLSDHIPPDLDYAKYIKKAYDYLQGIGYYGVS